MGIIWNLLWYVFYRIYNKNNIEKILNLENSENYIAYKEKCVIIKVRYYQLQNEALIYLCFIIYSNINKIT